MKIDGPGRSAPPAKSKKTGRTGSTSGMTFAPVATDETASAQKTGQAGPTAPVAATGSLLSLQEAPDPSSGRSQGLTRARTLLEQLEEVRRGLLLGVIPQNRLAALAEMARRNREAFIDPELSQLLDEIELRAEVELAKLEQR